MITFKNLFMKTDPMATETNLKQHFDSEFDIDRMDIISIERNGSKTTIAFYQGDELEEWVLKTSLEKHNDYISRFRCKLDRKKKTTIKTDVVDTYIDENDSKPTTSDCKLDGIEGNGYEPDML